MEKKLADVDVKISDDVVASITGLAACEVAGVDSMSGNLTSEIVAKIGIKNSSKGVKVLIQDGVVIADLYVNVLYGYSIPKVCALVQERVRAAIENMTGLSVEEVVVHVVGIIV